MKICFLTDNIHFLGGAQRCTVRLANELVKKGNEVTILYNNKDIDSNYNEYNLSDKVKLEYIKGTDFLPKIIFFWTKILEKINSETNLLKSNKKLLSFVYYGRNILAIKRLQKKFDTEKYDCVIGVGAIYSMILTLLKKNGTKFIGWQHSSSVRHFEWKNVLLWHQEAIFKKALFYLDEYVVLTQIDANYIKEKFGANVNVIYNPTSFETSIKDYNETRTILAVGRYHDVKGFDLLIEAFKIFNERNKDWKLRIVGEGEQRPKLQQLIDKYELKKSVLLIGKKECIIEEYKNSDFFVLSSRMEGMPMTVLEAMECGQPIIAFDLPCIPEILTEGQGIIVKSYNIKELANAMELLARNPKLREKMGRKCKNRVQEFNIRKILKKWEDLIK